MNVYHSFIDLDEGAKAVNFAKAVNDWLTYLKDQGVVDDWRLTRRKLGLAPQGLADFHLTIEVADLAQLDRAFSTVASGSEDVERFLEPLNHMIGKSSHALYRDFPDPEIAEHVALI